MKKRFILLASVLLLGTLVGCNNSNTPNTSSMTTSYGETGEITNGVKLTRSFAGKHFLTDGIGEVTLGSLTDGDTAKFIGKNAKGEDERFALRFLGVNTPESTAKVEPWGKPASVYVGKILSTAGVSIVLENDIPVWGQKDNNGTRYLGFVWYKLPGMEDYRLLNLELVENGYSRNQLFDDSTVCNYRFAFEAADESARQKGLKIHGEKDPGYDYDNQIKEVTIAECRRNYDDYGITDSFSGYQLRVEALVVGMIGDNMVLRDLQEDEETGLYAGMYAYLGYNTSLASAVGVGDVVKFYCRLTKFNSNMQFTDVKYSFIGKQSMVISAKGLTGPTEAYPAISLEPYRLDPKDISRSADIASYTGGYVETEVEIREINGDEEIDEDGIKTTGKIYYRKDANNNMTVYSKINNSSSFVPFNLRVDGSSSPYANYTLFTVGQKYRVRGMVAAYFENYQLQLFNQTSKDYIVAL